MKMLPSYLYNGYVVVTFVAVITYILLVAATSFKYLQNKHLRAIVGPLLVVSIIFTLPLLVVSPFGGRNFYLSYVCIAIALAAIAFDIFGAWLDKNISKYHIKQATYVCLVAATVMYMWIFIILCVRQVKNEQLAHEQLSQHKSEIVLRKFPFNTYIHDPHSGVKETRAYARQHCIYTKCSGGIDTRIVFK